MLKSSCCRASQAITCFIHLASRKTTRCCPSSETTLGSNNRHSTLELLIILIKHLTVEVLN